MTKWEYNEWEITDDLDLIKALNHIGALGWDAFKISRLRVGDQFKTQIIAKRCISVNETTNTSSPTNQGCY